MDSSAHLSDYLNLATRTSTFVSIDVVGSTTLKAGENEQDIIYTFLAYHKLVSDQAYAHHGEVINITGDGMMCRFERAQDAAHLALAILSELPAFNKKQNHLSRPVSLRLGVHTGEVRQSEHIPAGQMISQTLDMTAKLQQGAPANHARFSETTMTLLKEKQGSFARVGWDAALGMNVYETSGGQAVERKRRRVPDPTRILVVEQELDEIVKLKKTLFARHHDVMPVFTQNQAALCVASWQPHVIMLSVELPWDTGWELLVGLRADPKLSSVPLIVMSRQTTGDTIQKSFKLGANGFLHKPLEPQQILKRVEMVLREFYL